MKKRVLFIFILLCFVWAQALAIAHVYESEHLYHQTNTSCSTCAFLTRCSAADTPLTIAVSPSFDFQFIVPQYIPTKTIYPRWIYLSYFSQAPPAFIKLV